MEQRFSLVTLGVSDLARARAFYDGLGWHGQEVEETVFYQLGGLALVLWSRDKLAADAGVQDLRTPGAGAHDAAGFDGVVLAQNVRSPDAVRAALAEAEAAGATITRPAGDTFYGGYAGCFRDPDGHVWEIAFNPGFAIAPDGTITIPDLGDEPGGARDGSA